MTNAGHFCYCVSIKLGFHASSAIYFKRKNDNYFQLGFNLTLIYISLMSLCIRLCQWENEYLLYDEVK